MKGRSTWAVVLVPVTCAAALGIYFLQRNVPTVGVTPHPPLDQGSQPPEEHDKTGLSSVRATANVLNLDDLNEVQHEQEVVGGTASEVFLTEAGTESLQSTWSGQYAGWTVPALQGELADLERQVVELSKAPLKARHEQGLYDEVGVGPEVPMDRIWDPNVVMNVVIEPFGAEYFKVVLPREEFPEIYLLHDKKLWVAAEIQRRRN